MPINQTGAVNDSNYNGPKAENTIVQCITKHKASVNRLFCSIGKYINKSILAMSEFL
ncbi:MAG: hypothetical protein LBC61_05095 [Candidatus Peribacteria bacterium]|jgi:hypothetical protein|nr:hypothetical protein [Candidatus Peribacteria bacterium]